MPSLIALFLYNVGARLQELSERSLLLGDALVDRVRARWQASRPRVRA